MAAYVFRRILVLIPLLWAVATLTFFLMHAVPGGPFQGERSMSPALLARMNDKYGLNDSLGQQYIRFADNLLHGDLGISYATQQPVVDRIRAGMPTTLQLGLCAFVFAVALGVGLGVLSAVQQNGIVDYVGVFLATIGAAVPSFVLALLLVLAFSLHFRWFDVVGWQFGDYRSMTLPVVALGLLPAAFIARITRASLLDVLRQDYIRTAQAKGLRPMLVVGRHALRNALIPVLTVLGPILASLITGSFVIEYTFSIHGIGTAFVEAVTLRDYGMIMGTILVYASAIAICNMLVDVSYGIADPRIRY